MIEEQFQHFLVAKSNSSKCNMSAVTLVQNNAIIHILVTVVDQLVVNGNIMEIIIIHYFVLRPCTVSFIL